MARQGINPKQHIATGVYPAIHTVDAGECYDDQGEKRYDRCGYDDNCASLPGGYHHQAHHLLPVQSINAYTSEPNAADIKDAYWSTEWCINQDHNLMPLPIKQTYLRRPLSDTQSTKPKKDRKGRGAYPAALSLDLPAHNVDHNSKHAYNDEVTEALQTKIWTKIQKATSTGAHPAASAVAIVFSNLETHFKQQLEERGKRNDGTKDSIDFWKAGSKYPASNSMGVWWAAFSMGSDEYVEKTLDPTESDYRPRPSRRPW